MWAAPPADGGRHLAELGTCSGSGFHEDPASVPTWHNMDILYRTVITTKLDIKAQNAKIVIGGRAQYLQNPTTSWRIKCVKTLQNIPWSWIKVWKHRISKTQRECERRSRQRHSALYTSKHIIIITYHRQYHIDIYIYLTWRFQVIDCDRRLHTSNQPVLNHWSIYLHK